MCSVCARGYIQGPDDMHNLLYCMVMDGKIAIQNGRYRRVQDDQNEQSQERREPTQQTVEVRSI